MTSTFDLSTEFSYGDYYSLHSNLYSRSPLRVQTMGCWLWYLRRKLTESQGNAIVHWFIWQIIKTVMLKSSYIFDRWQHKFATSLYALRPKQNCRHSSGRHFWMHFLERKDMNFEQDCTEVCSLGSNNGISELAPITAWQRPVGSMS